MRWIATVLLVLSCLGCSSIERLFRNSPLRLSSGTDQADRVNLWPLVYKNGERMAVLWPLYDQDSQGFALRPLVTKDGSKWEVLPPIGYLDRETGDWWLLPAYSLGESHGLFPLYNRGWINNAGPIWWEEDEAGNVTRGGLFPVSRLGPGFNYVGPVWWNQEDGGYVRRGGLFPLAYVSPTLNHVGPMFWHRDPDSGELNGGGLFPLAWLTRSTSYVGPAWWHRDGQGALSSGGLFPLADFSAGFSHVGPVFWNRNAQGEITQSGMLPLAYFSERFNLAGPVFWWKNAEGEVERSGLFPLAYFGPEFHYAGPAFWWTDAGGKLLHGGVLPLAYFGTDWGIAGPVWWTEDAYGVFPLMTVSEKFSYAGPLWWHRNADGEVAAGGLFPLADFSQGFNHVGPVWWVRNDSSAVEQGGLFPLAKYGDGLNYTGPVYWNRDSSGEISGGGLFPVAHFSDEFNYAGPLWWNHGVDANGKPALSSYGVFPLASFSDQFNHLGPVVWNHHPDGALKYLYGLPLAGYSATADGQQTLITPLGATRYDAAGNLEWCNILGPLFHYARTREGGSFVAVTPFYSSTESPERSRWDVWPLIGREVQRNADGSTRGTATTALGGLVKFESHDGIERARGFPLFSYLAAEDSKRSIGDYLALFSYHDRGPAGGDLHCLTPLIFNYHSDGEAYSWNSLLGTVSYQQTENSSEFSLLYYLYRQKTVGTETSRDIFPFITLDTGEDRSGFSFFWRLLRWERKGDQLSGHFLFIPWGA